MPRLKSKVLLAARKARCFYFKFYCYANKTNSERYERSVLRKLAIQRVWSNRLSVIHFIEESVRDRCTKSHESIFLLAKSPKYYFDHKAIMEPAKYDGRKDTMHKGTSNKFVSDNTKYANGYDSPKERWPNTIRGYAGKDDLTGLHPQHHGNNIKSRLFGSKNQVAPQICNRTAFR